MEFLVIIPSRISSSRLPRKPLMDIAGKPMVVRVAERAERANPKATLVACDDEAIRAVCEAHGIRAYLTDPNCPTGTDRLAEVVTRLNLADETIIVNVQGDEPLIPVEVIGQVAQALADDPECAIATAAHKIYDVESFFNPNVVKVALDSQNRALTFSRAPIPWPRDAFLVSKDSLPDGFAPLHHIGLYAYRAGFLKRFPTLARAPIEAFESLEQLRALYFGYKIKVITLEENLPAGVDTEEDLERVRSLWKA